MHIFVDESGDLGFDFLKPGKPSDFFLVGALKISDEKHVNRVIRRHRKRLKKPKEKKELKFSNTSPENRRRILNDIAKLNCGLFFIFINKRSAYDYIKNDPVRMYSYLLRILVEKCFSEPIREDVKIIFDRSLSNVQQEALELYLRTQNENIFSAQNKIEMLHIQSQEKVGLMCIDFACGAAMSKITGKSEVYYNIIKGKVVHMKQIY